MTNTTLSNPFPDIFSAAFLINNIGAPFAIGLAVGYFAKKMLRLALFIAGMALVFLFMSEYWGIVEISDAQLQQAATTASNMAKSSGNFLIQRVSQITSKGVSGSAGFFVGLKLG
ncbi:MAG: FUN14 domain-containing protein [Methylococcaceae bacterium]